MLFRSSPRAALVEGIVASAESAADGLPPTPCAEMLAATGRARKFAQANAFHEAVVAAAEAIAVYARSMEEARQGETMRIAAPRPDHDPDAA